jgi:hypothetical protein
MRLRIGRWLLGLAALLVFAGVYTPPEAKAETHIAVSVGHTHHRYHRRHYRRHYVVYYRHGRRYREYR